MVPIAVLPLREHVEDLLLLVKHFVDQFHRDSARSPKVIDPSAIRLLQSYSWPGNVRELKNIIERLLIMVDQDVILADDVANILPILHRSAHSNAAAAYQGNRYQMDKSLLEMVDEAEASLILEALEANG